MDSSNKHESSIYHTQSIRKIQWSITFVTLLSSIEQDLCNIKDFSLWLSGKESACNAGDVGSIPGLGRSPGEGNGNPLQYFCLRNSMDRGASVVHGIEKSQTQLSDFHFSFFKICFCRVDLLRPILHLLWSTEDLLHCRKGGRRVKRHRPHVQEAQCPPEVWMLTVHKEKINT